MAISRCRPTSGVLLILASTVLAWLLSCSSSADPENPNVVLIVVDALRPDHLGCYGYHRPASPVIDHLAEGGVLFETAVSPAPWTKTSFSSFLTSLYPFQHGVVDWESILPDTLVTLAEILKAHGYGTMAVVNMLGIADRFQVLKGFDQVDAVAKYKRNADETTAAAIELMQGSSRPFFIMIHYFDAHWPYRPPPAYVDMVGEDPGINPFTRMGLEERRDTGKPSRQAIDRQVLLYDACIRYTDHNIGNIVDYLEESGIRGETLIVVTADHGEAFWEHEAGSHGHSVFDEEMRVPMVLVYPARFGNARKVKAQVSLIDLLPTIVGLTGITDDNHREGRNLVDLIEEGKLTRGPGSLLPADLDLCESTLRKAPATKGIRSLDWKLVIEPATGLIELFNLKDDPGENENLSDSFSSIRDSLHGHIRAIPGASMNGWRLGFTGAENGPVFQVSVDIGSGGRLNRLERLVSGGEFLVEIAGDSTAFDIKVEPRRQQIVVFDVTPPDAGLRFEIKTEEQAGPDFVGVGSRDRRDLDEAFELTPEMASGLPRRFDPDRRSHGIGAYVWWLPGQQMVSAREAARLTPEERRRLKALGYIQ